MVQALIFDADHTLYTPQSEKAYRRKFKFLADRLGISSERLHTIWEQQVEEVIGSSDPEQRDRHRVLEKTLEELELPRQDRESLVEDALERFWTQVVDDLVFDAGTPELLQELEDSGLRIVAVVSDEFRKPLERKLRQVLGDWQDYFEMLVTPRTVKRMKPSTRYYEEVLEQEGLDAGEVAVVGDSWERDLQPARELGMTTVLVGEEPEGSPDFHVPIISRLQEIAQELREA